MQCLIEFIVENSLGAIGKITQNWQVKTIVGIIGAWAVSVCDYIDTPLVMFLILVTADFLSKMMALGHSEMKKKNLRGNLLYAMWYGFRNKDASQSHPMRVKGVNKIVQYMFVLTAAFTLGKVIPPIFSEYANFAFDWIIFYLSVGEVKSIFENLHEAGMEEAAFFIRLFGDKKKQLEDKMSGK